MNGLDEVVRLVRAGRRFLVTGHANPDGDALGSMLATLHGLRALGKEVVAYDHDPAPRRLGVSARRRRRSSPTRRSSAGRSTPPSCTTAVTRTCSAIAFPARDVTGPLIVRRPSRQRARLWRPVAARRLERRRWASSSRACSTRSACRLDKTIAECLWCSLVSDTGWFRYASTDVETMRLATACVEAGAVPWDFARRSEESPPPARLKLMARVFDTLELVGARGAA